MEQVKRKLKSAAIFTSAIILFFLGMTYYYHNINKTIVIPSDIEKGVERIWKEDVTIRSEKDFTFSGRNFKMVLSTPVNDKRYEYFNCFEQKLGGLYYRSYQGAEQGASNAFIHFSEVFMNSPFNSENEKDFIVVYGYNEDLLIDSYGIKLNTSSDMVTSNIGDREYFIDAFPGEFAGSIECTGKDGSDIIKAFVD